MADNKDDKSEREHASVNDSGELLKALFRKELDAIAAENRNETAAKTSDKTSAPQKPKSPAQGKGAGREKARPQMGTGERKIVKNYPVSKGKVRKSRKVAPNIDTWLKKGVEEEASPQIKEDPRQKVRHEEGIDIRQIKGGKAGIGGNLELISDKLKVALLSLLLVAAVAFLLSSLGVVDFGQLLGLSASAKRVSGTTGAAKNPPAKTSTPLAPKLTQKTTYGKASGKTPAQEREPIVRIPSKATLSKERHRIVHRRTKPVTSTQKSIIVQEHPKPSASTQEPVIAGQPPKPIASPQEEVVPRQPAETAVHTGEFPVSKTPAEPVGPQKPPEYYAPKVQHEVAKVASSSAESTPEKAALAKEKVFPGERDLSYPYSIYLGSYKTRERAERAMSEYGKKGLSPYWVKVDLVDKGVWYRVFTGYFQKREQANEFIKKKQIGESESRHTRYANLIGLFAFQKQLDEEKLRLSKLGYCPYIIPGRNGESLLYIGAFYQKARAQREHAELASKGIHSQIVER